MCYQNQKSEVLFSFRSHEIGLLFFPLLFNRSRKYGFQRHHRYNKFNPVSNIVKHKDKQISEIINMQSYDFLYYRFTLYAYIVYT